ncbi:hypothetical protein I4U23_005125 [Adineta vaga]|nr:hypothetical protein I4U23_005125 [Adineta vaga]
MYIGDTAITQNNELRILEEIYIDPNNCKTIPYATVPDDGYFPDESEILLSIGSVFRVKSVSESNLQNGSLWTVQLDLIDNDEKMIEEFHQYLEFSQYALNDINKAPELRSNEENLTGKERESLPILHSHAHENLGILYKDNTYPKFEEALNTQRHFAPKHPNMIKTLNNIAMVCSNVGDMEAFMNYSQEALPHHNFNTALDIYARSALLKQYSLLTKLYTQTALTYLEQNQIEAAL